MTDKARIKLNRCTITSGFTVCVIILLMLFMDACRKNRVSLADIEQGDTAKTFDTVKIKYKWAYYRDTFISHRAQRASKNVDTFLHNNGIKPVSEIQQETAEQVAMRYRKQIEILGNEYEAETQHLKDSIRQLNTRYNNRYNDLLTKNNKKSDYLKIDSNTNNYRYSISQYVKPRYKGSKSYLDVYTLDSNSVYGNGRLTESYLLADPRFQVYMVGQSSYSIGNHSLSVGLGLGAYYKDYNINGMIYYPSRVVRGFNYIIQFRKNIALIKFK